MTTKKGSTKRPAKGKAAADEVGKLAYHLSEAMRIMSAAEWVPSGVYNDFAEALNDMSNTINDDSFIHSEAYIRLELTELAKKGGAK